MLQDIRSSVADWLALACFGRDKLDQSVLTPFVIDGVKLSRRTVALLYADIELLMALKSN